jgi:glycosyltransferase involved in cell wall biosynthesis
MTVKCDFHVHSRYSVKPTNWVTKKFGAPESYTEPKQIYETAMRRGMTHVTITDHNNIKGALKLMDLGYDNTFVSCEVTAKFPEDGCKVHVLVYDITKEQYKDIMDVRKNVYELVMYLRANGVWHAIAHPLYSVNNKLTQVHLEKLLLLFNLLELNGFKSTDTNNTIRFIVENLTDDILLSLADKHNITEPLVKAKDKRFIRGSDDHSGMFVAKNYTLNMSGSHINVVFDNPQHNEIKGTNGTPQDLAYALYSIGYQYLDHRFDVKKYVHTDDAVKLLDHLLGPGETSNGSPFWGFIKRLRGNGNHAVEGNVRQQLFQVLASMGDVGKIDKHNVSEKWFDVVSSATDATIKETLDYLIKQFDSKNIFNIFQTLGNMSSLYMLTVPYYVSYFIFQQTRNFSTTLNIEDKIVTQPAKRKVAHFTDTFYEVNGVVKTLRQAQRTAHKYGFDYTFITCVEKDSELGEVTFKPVETYPLEGYEELAVAIPPLLDMLEYCYRENFTHIHAATPGPVGLAGMLIAKILQRPFISTYHTAFPQYVEAGLDDAFMTDACWQYMRWFYNKCLKVFVPSQALIEDLREHNVNKDNLFLFPRGIDIERFHPTEKMDSDDDKFYLLYVGRVSKEKNLDILAEAFKRLDNENVELIIVGDGPYRKDMEKSLKGFSATFTGYLNGEALVQAYQQADLFVFPSTTDTFGNVVLEAHACGIPTLVTDMGGPAESVVDGETGRVVKGNDVHALKAGIIGMLDKALLNKLGAQAREVVEKRSFDHAFLEWIKLYD